MSVSNSHGRIFLPDPTHDPALDLAHVGYRLATLSALPASVPVSRIKLANAGYCYLGQGEEVTCYTCSSRHSGWTREDDPMAIHRRQSPECPHVVERDREAANAVCPITGDYVGTSAPRGLEQPRVPSEANVSAGGFPRQQHAPQPTAHSSSSSSSSSSSPALTISTQPFGNQPGLSSVVRTPVGNAVGLQEDTPHSEEVEAGTAASHQEASQAVYQRTENTISNEIGSSTGSSTADSSDDSRSTSGGTIHAARAEPRPVFPGAGLDLGGAVYPMFQDTASRRRTFSQWDASQAPPLDAVILSGMFYAGYADCVRCFYCGVGLKHWVVTDDVWTEHVRWRPTCQYLAAVKGPDFVTDTQRTLAMMGSNQPENITSSGARIRCSSNPPTSQTTQQASGATVPTRTNAVSGIEAPTTPEAPEAPEAPGSLEASDAPEVSEAPEAPEVSEAPEAPEATEAPEVSEAPEAPEAPGH